jgi:hypothetical protein
MDELHEAPAVVMYVDRNSALLTYVKNTIKTLWGDTKWKNFMKHLQ